MTPTSSSDLERPPFWRRPFRLDAVSTYRNEIYGFAIIWIVIFHATAIDHVDYTFGHKSLQWVQDIIQIGNVGVDAFLFLSGVCMYYSFSKNPSLKDFYRKRVVRILPSVWVINGLYWLVKFAIMRGDVGGFVSRMLLAQFWITGDASIWFVSLIVVLYLAYPLIYKVLFGVGLGTPTLRFVALMALAYAGVVALSIAAPDYYDKVEIAITRIPVFVLGCYLGKFVKEGKTLPPVFTVLAFVLVVVFEQVCAAKLLSGMEKRFFFLVGGVAVAYALAIVFDCICAWRDRRRRTAAAGAVDETQAAESAEALAAGSATAEALAAGSATAASAAAPVTNSPQTSAQTARPARPQRPLVLRAFAYVGTFSLELYLSHIMCNQVLRMTPWFVDASLAHYAVAVAFAFPIAWGTMKLLSAVRRK